MIGCRKNPERARPGAIRWLWRALTLAAVGLLAVVNPRVLAAESSSGASSAKSPTSNPAPAPVPSSRLAPNLAVITIHGPIDAVTTFSVKRRIEAAAAAGADGIVFDIDSPGGEVGAVVEISRLIKQSPVSNTVAWVNPNAYSGGAVLALACRQIVLAPGATMGDIGVIGGDPLGLSFFQGLKPTERAKGLSLVIPEIVDSARANGYDEKLVQGFVTLGVELWRIRDKQTGEEYFVDEPEYRAIFGEIPPRHSPHVGSVGLTALNKKSAEQGDGVAVDFSEMRSGGNGSERPADERMQFRPASPELAHENLERAFDLAIRTASTRPNFSAGDRDRYELIEYATDGATLLTLKEADLKRYGFADTSITIKNDEELKKYMGATNLRRLDQNWSESLVGFMTMGGSGLAVRGILVIVFLMGLFIEMASPGVGLPGVIAVLALAGLVVPPMLIGASSWWAAASVVTGIALIMLEVFVLPGFGVPGVLGLLLLLLGLVGAFAGVGELFPGSGAGGGTDLAWAMSIVLLGVFVAGTGAYFFSRYTHRFPLAGRLVLADTQRNQDDEERASSLLMAMGAGPQSTERALVSVGDVGVTTTPLRPSGSALFNDDLVDVVSEFGFVEAGSAVRVVAVTQYRVGVEPTGGQVPPADGGTRA